MLNLLLLATLSAPLPVQPASLAPMPLVQEDEHPGPDKQTIERTLDELKIAFAKATELPDRIAAIERAADVPCDAVAKALGAGLDDKQLDVVNATLGVLAKMDADRALDELVHFYKKDRRLKKDPELLASSLKAIAWHHDPGTVDLFKQNVFTDSDRGVIQARILGLGMIRTASAAEAVMDLMKSASRKKIQPYMDDLSLALAVLTGADNGKDQDRWIAWWNDNKRDLEVAEEQPEIGKQLQRKWDRYWGIKNKMDRGEKREDRGSDGE